MQSASDARPSGTFTLAALAHQDVMRSVHQPNGPQTHPAPRAGHHARQTTRGPIGRSPRPHKPQPPRTATIRNHTAHIPSPNRGAAITHAPANPRPHRPRPISAARHAAQCAHLCLGTLHEPGQARCKDLCRLAAWSILAFPSCLNSWPGRPGKQQDNPIRLMALRFTCNACLTDRCQA